MSEELVELVVQLYEKNWGVRDYGLARAVVALVRSSTLEEAAQVADIGWFSSEFCAAAIRALKEK